MYSDDDLVRMLAKTVGVQGGKDRADAIRAELQSRGVSAPDDARQAFFEALRDDQSAQ